MQRKQKKAQLKAQAAKAAEEKMKERSHGKGGGGGAAEEDKKAEEKEPKFDSIKLLQARQRSPKKLQKTFYPLKLSTQIFCALLSKFLSVQKFVLKNVLPLQTDKPLEVAVKFLVPLQLLSPSNVTTHTLGYEIHSRRGQFLLMLQALKRLHAIDPDDGELHRMLVDFVLAGELFANLSNTHSLMNTRSLTHS